MCEIQCLACFALTHAKQVWLIHPSFLFSCSFLLLYNYFYSHHFPVYFNYTTELRRKLYPMAVKRADQMMNLTMELKEVVHARSCNSVLAKTI